MQHRKVGRDTRVKNCNNGVIEQLLVRQGEAVYINVQRLADVDARHTLFSCASCYLFYPVFS